MKKSPKIYVLGSNSFVHQMVAAKDKLRQIGLDGWIHNDYQEHVDGTKLAFIKEHKLPGESAAFKKAHDYIRQHYKHILESDAILIVNLEKHGSQNYIGGNCLMEMGMAYVNDKKIFLLQAVPKDSLYLDEIMAMEPVCLHGNIADITKYV